MLDKATARLVQSWLAIVVGAVLGLGALSVLVFTRREVHLPPLMRISPEAGSKAKYLEVPLVRYVKSGQGRGTYRVDFVGAVHLGERAYYADLNERFRRYDAVLFELISDGERPSQRGEERGDSLLGTVQRAMAELVGLSFQLDEVNYQAPNLVHADLSPHELSRAMEARGESLPQLLMKIITLSADPEFQKSLQKNGMEENMLEGINPLLILLRGPTNEERMKIRRFLAQGLAGSEEVFKALEGDKGISLISDRNNQAVAVLRRELASGKKNLAIFYGVGHLPDLHNRLLKEGFTISSVEWLKAWNM